MNKVVLSVMGVCLAAAPVFAFDDDNNNQGLQAVPWTFVGTAPGCAPAPPGSNIVTSTWLRGLGLPDNGGPNSQLRAISPASTRNDPHTGLLLSKNGPTADCSSAGATITGVR